MVEFRSIQEARNAKLHLNGADIFPGCCTLKVDYARPARLSVPRNDQDNWDFEKCERDPSCNFQDDHYQNSLLGKYLSNIIFILQVIWMRVIMITNVLMGSIHTKIRTNTDAHTPQNVITHLWDLIISPH